VNPAARGVPANPFPGKSGRPRPPPFPQHAASSLSSAASSSGRNPPRRDRLPPNLGVPADPFPDKSGRPRPPSFPPPPLPPRTSSPAHVAARRTSCRGRRGSLHAGEPTARVDAAAAARCLLEAPFPSSACILSFLQEGMQKGEPLETV
jgi:hypothetical protein